MKTLIFFLLIALPLFSQEDWFWLHPWPQGNSLNDVFVFDNNKMISVGSKSTILSTKDGGESWNINYYKDHDIDFKSIHFINSIVGWISGIKNRWTDSTQSLIFKTMDGGNTWDLLHTFDQIELSNVQFWDDNKGWALGYSITSNTTDFFRTDNGGENWTSTNISESVRHQYDAQFISRDVGWISCDYDGGFYKTIDGGITWDSLGKGFSDIHFMDKNIGWALSNICWWGCFYKISKTTDGGVTWDSLFTGYGYTESIYFNDSLNGWIIGGQNYKTTDGGVTWDTLYPINSWWNYTNHWGQPYSTATSIAFNKSGLTGYIIRSTGEIIKTIDSGRTWSFNSNLETNLSINSIFFTNQKNGWAVGGEDLFDGEDTDEPFGIILKTNNGGTSWANVTIPGYFSDQWNSPNIAKDIFFTDENNGWIVGDFRPDGIFKTNDGGNNWNAVKFQGYNRDYNSVYFLNPDTGWIAGRIEGVNWGIIRKTTDGGTSWIEYKIEIENTTLNDIVFINQNRGFAIGNEGTILETTDGGDTWNSLQITDSTISLSCLFFYDNNNGWIAGYKTNYPSFEVTLYKTTDGGLSWESHLIRKNLIYKVNSIWFKNSQIGFVLTEGLNEDEPGLILTSKDGGITWKSYNSLHTSGLNTIFFIDKNTGWLGGHGGTILKTTTGGVTWVGESLQHKLNTPLDYELYQNYPNPFNPSTTIKYEIPDQVRNDKIKVETHGHASVQLKVYDILGREVATLVNKKQKTGYYEVGWNATNQPSGVYFYQLTAGNYSEVKKMILLH